MNSRPLLRSTNAVKSVAHLSVRGKLVLLILCILVPMLILEGFNIHYQFTQQVQRQMDDNRDYAQAIGTAYTNYLDTLWDTEAALGGAFALDGANLSADQIESLMRAQIALHPTVTLLLWVNPEGQVMASSRPGGRGVQVGDRAYVRHIIDGEDAVVSDLIEGRVSGDVTIGVARGVRREGSLVGILIAGVDIGKLDQVLPVKQMANRSFGLVDRQANIIFRSGTQSLSMEQRHLAADAPARRALAGEVAVYSRFQSGVDGTLRMGAAVPISRIGWAVFASAPVQDALADAWDQTARTLVVGVLVIGISLVGVWLISSRLVRPIQDLHRAALAITHGDLSARAEYAGKDELGTMAQAFNRMAVEIHELVRERDRRADDLQLLVERDHLTGLFNHRAFQTKLDGVLAAGRHTDQPTSLLMIDIDHFKAYNDAYGHPMGDQALRRVADLLQAHVRDHDVVCRYGGEEMSVILPGTGPGPARDVAGRLREAIATARFPDADGVMNVRLTVSIGGATCPVDAPDKESLIARADAALYRAKHLGRDRVEMHG